MVTDFLYDNNLFSDEAIGPAAERIFNSAQKNAEQIPSTLQSYMEQLRTVDKKIKHTVEAISNGMYPEFCSKNRQKVPVSPVSARVFGYIFFAIRCCEISQNFCVVKFF